MDPGVFTALAAATLAALQPYWPALAAKAAEALGEQAPAAVGGVWTALKERFARKPAAQESLADLLKKPDDPDLQAAFRVQLKKLLEEDAAFADELKQRLESAGTQITYRAEVTGDSNVTVQGAGNVVTVTPLDSAGKKK
jgi:hypothetical protein